MTRTPRPGQFLSAAVRNTFEVLWASSAKLADRTGLARNLERQRGGSPRNAKVKSDPRLRALLRQIAEKGLYPLRRFQDFTD